MSGSAELYMDDAVEAVSGAVEELKNFLNYYKEQYPTTPVDALPAPYIDDVTHPVTVNAKAVKDFGINDESVAAESDELSVLVYIDGQVAVGDNLLLKWNDTVVAGGVVTQAESDNKYKTVVVKGKDVPEGSALLHYMVFKKTGGLLFSPKVSTLFIKGQPGVEGENGVGTELKAPKMTRPATGAVGPDEARAGVIVTVPVYYSMRAGDRIYLSWGNQIVIHEVTQAQLGKPVDIVVSESLIADEGDSEELFLYYFVRDLVGNESEWSDWVEIEVKLSAVPPDAPQVLNEEGAVITTGEIKITDIRSDYVAVQLPGKYKIGDSLLLHMVGKTQQDQTTFKDFGPLTVQDADKPQQINVPFDEWWPLGGGSAQFSFTVTSGAGMTSKSKKTYIRVLGMPSLLPAPEMYRVENFRVDADRSYVNVLIPALANTKYKDKIRLSYEVVGGDGVAVSIPIKAEQVSARLAGKPFPFRLKGEVYLKPFEGGYVDLSYVIESEVGEYKSGSIRYEIGEPIASLPAPTTEVPLINNVLNPDNESYDFNMVVKIPKEAEQPPCKLVLYWESSEGETGWDELDVAQVSTDGIDFEVPRSVFEPKADSPVNIKFYYKVVKSGRPTVVSKPLEFTVATTEIQRNFVDAPTVPLAVNDKLNLTPIVNNILSVLLDNPSLAIGDEVVIKAGSYRTGKILLKKTGPHTQALPIDQVLAQNLQAVLDPANFKLMISYELVRNGTTQVKASKVKLLHLEGALTKENFEAVKLQSLPVGRIVECPALSMKMLVAGGALFKSYCASWYPTWGTILSTNCGAQVEFKLRGLARTVNFDVADDCALISRGQKHYVIFYTASGAEIGRTNYLVFNRSPSGYTRYSMRVTFTTPSSAIKSFRFVDGGSNVHLDNISYTPF
ncbi:hypothetical protein [Pseudomonas oryzicola]|uniref:Uncharacterized protein n=1 Tax=Pseudomonas oryzicola TaxID=485876 RepID=A0ABS6Q9C9_9PSED|nr:hypothetical protein [Pseudomonas oryzicola]MBV4490797.1 hypothetical protein [Pseudomonas oryzicola]